MTATVTQSQLERIGDLEVRLSVELGGRSMSISELLTLGEGALITLDTGLNAPLEVYANGRRFASGELVELDDRFGLRITAMGSGAAQ
jgi:flagellar motor switch protein FliN/FliY